MTHDTHIFTVQNLQHGESSNGARLGVEQSTPVLVPGTVLREGIHFLH